MYVGIGNRKKIEANKHIVGNTWKYLALSKLPSNLFRKAESSRSKGCLTIINFEYSDKTFSFSSADNELNLSNLFFVGPRCVVCVISSSTTQMMLKIIRYENDEEKERKNRVNFNVSENWSLLSFDAIFGFKRIKLHNPIKSKKRYRMERKTTYIPMECANDAGIFSGSVSFVLSVIIIIVRFQLVHATF